MAALRNKTKRLQQKPKPRKHSKKRTLCMPPSQGLYKGLHLRNFRGFHSFEIDGFDRINLLLGPNNVGKTSLLEGVFAHACGLNLAPFYAIVSMLRQEGRASGWSDFGEKTLGVFRRNQESDFTFEIDAQMSDVGKSTLRARFEPSSLLENLAFGNGYETHPGHDFITREEIETYSDYKNRPLLRRLGTVFLGMLEIQSAGKTEAFELRYPPEFKSKLPFRFGLYSGILDHRDPMSDIQIFSKLKRANCLEEFTRETREVFKSIVEIDQIPFPDGSQGPVYVRMKDGNQNPLYLFGDGFRRWFFLIGRMVLYKGYVHCIEEVDATFHPSAQRSLSRLLAQYAQKYNNQLFMTTHSIEFTDNFLDALYGENGTLVNCDDIVRVITMHPSDTPGTPMVRVLNGREAHRHRENYRLDLR